MNTFDYSQLDENEIKALCSRPRIAFEAILEEIRPVIEEVRTGGDRAVLQFTQTFDGVSPDPLVVDPLEMDFDLGDAARDAIDTAYRNIYRFHKTQIPAPVRVETMPGVKCSRVARPIERAGLYVPGGTATLPSTLLMLAIPAALAGCSEIVVATPPGPGGRISPEIGYIAKKTGIRTVLLAGGAQAIAAMAYGTESVPKVDKIAGPGNQYVTAAKMWLQNSDAMVSIDMPAGPSEVLVIADGSADPGFVAADLLSQAEHGPDSHVVLAATPSFDLERLRDALDRQLDALPRKDIAGKALENSFIVRTRGIEEALEFSNRYAPEHLVLQCEEARTYTDRIRHAGSVFLGPWTPESAGDYASGTNHTLPTYGYARMYSGLSVESFMKFITMQEISREGLEKIGPAVEKLAEMESLEAHRRAVRIRLDRKGEGN